MSTKQLFQNTTDTKSIEAWFNSFEYSRQQVTSNLIGKTDVKAIIIKLK